MRILYVCTAALLMAAIAAAGEIETQRAGRIERALGRWDRDAEKMLALYRERLEDDYEKCKVIIAGSKLEYSRILTKWKRRENDIDGPLPARPILTHCPAVASVSMPIDKE